MAHRNKEIIEWFNENPFKKITDTSYTWEQLAEKFNTTPKNLQEIFYYNKKVGNIKDNTNLVLRSRWQTQTKNGIEWLESYRNIPEEFDINIDEILSNIKLEPYGYIRYKKQESNKSLVLYISDQHIGASVSEDSLYDNQFNEDILNKRYEVIYSKLLELHDAMGRFDSIYICMLGDAIDSYNNKTARGDVSLESNMTNHQMFDCFINSHAKLFHNIYSANIANHIKVHIVANSNHSGDIEYMAAKALKYYCGSIKMPIEVNIITKFLDYIQINNHVFILTHGKDKKYRRQGMPKNIDNKTIVYLEEYIKYHNLYNNDIHVIKGDLHIQNSEESKFFRYRNVGSIFGASDWIMHNFGNTLPSADYDLIINNNILEGKITL